MSAPLYMLIGPTHSVILGPTADRGYAEEYARREAEQNPRLCLITPIAEYSVEPRSVLTTMLQPSEAGK